MFVLCINTMIAVSLNYGFRTGGSLWHNFVYSHLIGLSIWLLIDVARVLIWWNERPRRWPFLCLTAIAVPLGVIMGSWATRIILNEPAKSFEEAADAAHVPGGRHARFGQHDLFLLVPEKLAHLERQAALDALQREEAEKQLVRARLDGLAGTDRAALPVQLLANLDCLIATDQQSRPAAAAAADRLPAHVAVAYARQSSALAPGVRVAGAAISAAPGPAFRHAPEPSDRTAARAGGSGDFRPC
ncbi:hypothetical protein ACU4GD_39430 [Cupriavidus basilensis]